jgi:hypothetical protein
MKRSKFTDEQILATVKEGEAGPEGRPLVSHARDHRTDVLPLEGYVRRLELSDMQRLKQWYAPSRSAWRWGWLVDAHGTSLRRACRVVGLSTATWRYQRRGRVDNRRDDDGHESSLFETARNLNRHSAYGVSGSYTRTVVPLIG